MKKITTFSKEVLNGKFVNVIINGQSGVGQIMYEEAETDDNVFFIFQNIEEGIISDTLKNSYFKYSFLYIEGEIEIHEMTEEGQKEVDEKLLGFSKLQNGTEVFIPNGRLFLTVADAETRKLSNNSYIDWDSKYIIVESQSKFVNKLLDSIAKNKYLSQEGKATIDGYAGSGRYPVNSAIYFEINNIKASLYIDDNFIIRSADLSSRGYDLTHSIEDNYHEIWNEQYLATQFDEVLKRIEAIFEKTTLYSPSFKNIIKLNNEDDLEFADHILNGEYYHKMQFIDFDVDEKMITFIPKGKNLVFEGDSITTKNRQSIKPHKFFNTILKDKYSEYDIKTKVDKLLTYKECFSVRYFRGRKMAENYSLVNTREWSTQSCMDRKAENFFELYTDRRFRLGVIYKNKEVVARFIEVTADCGFVYNDRLYYKDEQVLAWYNSWVDKNKLNRKLYNNHSSTDQFYNVTKGSFVKYITVTLRKSLDAIKIYPYMDTLAWGHDNKLMNSGHIPKTKVTYQLRNTGGSCERLNCKMDVITGRYIDISLAVQIQFGHHNGKYTTVENLIYSATNGGHCLK